MMTWLILVNNDVIMVRLVVINGIASGGKSNLASMFLKFPPTDRLNELIVVPAISSISLICGTFRTFCPYKHCFVAVVI